MPSAPPQGPTALGLAGSGAAIAAPHAQALTDVQQTLPLIWVLLALSIVGAAITWGVLLYALWKFRDPATRGRRYG